MHHLYESPELMMNIHQSRPTRGNSPLLPLNTNPGTITPVTTTSANSTPSSSTRASISEQIHDILYATDSPSRWDFLATKQPFPGLALVKNSAIKELLTNFEPGPKVNVHALKANLTILKKRLLETNNGRALLAFFQLLLQLKATWLLAAAKLEAFRAYNIQREHYYVTSRQDTNDLEPDAAQAYINGCQEYDRQEANVETIEQEESLMATLREAAVKLVLCKLSKAMWRQSMALWEICNYYEAKVREQVTETMEMTETKRKVSEELLRRRAIVRVRNDDMQRRQMSMQLVEHGNVIN